MNTKYCPLVFTILSDRERMFQDIDIYKFKAHNEIIKPMLAAAKQAFVFKGTAEPLEGAFGHMTPPAMDLSQFKFLFWDKGKYQVNLDQECVIGYEHLWNASGYRRGSIVIILPYEYNFPPLLPHCYDFGLTETPNMGQSPGAVKMCRRIRDMDSIAAMFSSSNGIEYMEVYASDNKTEEIENLAVKLCGSNLERRLFNS
ncbi:hypothetical protein [Paenibacillus macquariensis]|uniref:Uncharacterized protein n=1 Tax=Paenibacillus macquariensis TaxID=948756 RepID=A0ABY1JVB3_9BACL|nr:hypothetical protein [Paenibacillus macquariensis]MEC0090824.1 hypothetical protein [Paenibacillus macquariensis]SIQ82811.1 hypothetical protein SAMN05421578_104241 [Paenibacillus macquariensis]